MGIEILQPGLLTTVQDLGRFGYQKFGLTPAGAMDRRSFCIANYLVGNRENEATLEITLAGPKLRFTANTTFAVTGGDLMPQLNGAPVQMYCAHPAAKGDVLSFAGLRSGCRSYIAFAGGLDVPVVMGSRATHLRSGIGGYRGRKLLAGDILNFRHIADPLPDLSRRFITPEDFSADTVELRILLGPQEDRFTKAGIATLLRESYTVKPQSDRMGYRLSGAKLEHTQDANIISDGIALGAIQVPGDGQPIIMMADRQSTGGYTKIANVISVDIPKLAQCKPGSKLRFRLVSLEQAQQLYRQEHVALQQLKQRFGREDVLLTWHFTEEDEFSITIKEEL